MDTILTKQPKELVEDKAVLIFSEYTHLGPKKEDGGCKITKNYYSLPILTYEQTRRICSGV